MSVSFQVQIISFFFLSPYFLAPCTDTWTNSCKYVNILFLASAQGTPQGHLGEASAGDNQILP